MPLCRYAFLSIVVASMAAITLSGCAGAAMALAGMAYWSLATQNVVYVALNTALLWHYSPWRPSVRGITFAPVRRMFRFSCKILASTVTTHINNNVLNILLGHYFSTADAGPVAPPRGPRGPGRRPLLRRDARGGRPHPRGVYAVPER